MRRRAADVQPVRPAARSSALSEKAGQARAGRAGAQSVSSVAQTAREPCADSLPTCQSTSTNVQSDAEIEKIDESRFATISLTSETSSTP